MDTYRLGISRDDAVSKLAASSLAVYEEEIADIAHAFVDSERASWIMSAPDPNAPLSRLLFALDKMPDNLHEGLKLRDQGVIDFLLSKVTIWQLGVCLAKLNGKVRQVELQRLAIGQFWKSQYVLLIAALLTEGGCSVLFGQENAAKSPDLIVDSDSVECKECEIGPSVKLDYRHLIRDAKAKFNKHKRGSGVVFLEIDPRVLLLPSIGSWEEQKAVLIKNTETALSTAPNIGVAVLTVRRINSTGTDFGAPLILLAIANPKNKSHDVANKYANFFREKST